MATATPTLRAMVLLVSLGSVGACAGGPATATSTGGATPGPREPAARPADVPDAGVVPLVATIEASFVGLAEAMPADRWNFRPTDGDFATVRTFAEQVKHVACSNYAFFNQIEGVDPPPDCATGGAHPAAGKAELVAYLRESFAYARNVIGRMTPENAYDVVSGPYGGTSTRIGMTAMGVWHASDHYGQVVVYARMNGVVPGR